MYRRNILLSICFLIYCLSSVYATFTISATYEQAYKSLRVHCKDCKQLYFHCANDNNYTIILYHVTTTGTKIRKPVIVKQPYGCVIIPFLQNLCRNITMLDDSRIVTWTVRCVKCTKKIEKLEYRNGDSVSMNEILNFHSDQ